MAKRRKDANDTLNTTTSSPKPSTQSMWDRARDNVRKSLKSRKRRKPPVCGHLAVGLAQVYESMCWWVDGYLIIYETYLKIGHRLMKYQSIFNLREK